MIRRFAVGALVLLSVGSLSTQVGVGAQDSSDVVRGGANAHADSMATLINNAGAALGWTFGRSTAAYRDITATAEGKAVDLGALEALLTQPQCMGAAPPALNAATLPPKTIADSTVAGSEVEQSTSVNYPQLTTDTTTAGPVGTQSASATKTPSSQSSTETLDQDFGFFRVEGAHSEAMTSFVDGVRLAEASTTAKRVVLFGGQVVFYEPVWHAKAWSGADSGEEASFTFASAQVFGNWVSGSNLERDLAFFKSIVEGLLGPLGVKISFPVVTDPIAGDGIVISPLAFTMADAPIGTDLLIPLLETPFMRDVRNQSVEDDCTAETAWTILDALERALGGSGSVQILVGGATATTDDTDYSFTPMEEPSAGGAEETTTTVAQAPLDTSVPFDDFSSDFGSDFDLGFEDFSLGDDMGLGFEDAGLDGGLPAETASVRGAAVEASDDDLTDGREIAAGDSDSKAGNAAAIAVGVLALLGAVGLSLGDRVMGLRAGRRIP
ncbi:MAG: hypothetical protein ACK5O2_12860 [Microthrixaceae bacterium]